MSESFNRKRQILLTRESIDSYRPDDELVILARDAGFVMPDFAVEYGNDWSGRKVTLMWIALAKFRHLVQQEEKVKFADAYVEFKKEKNIKFVNHSDT